MGRLSAILAVATAVTMSAGCAEEPEPAIGPGVYTGLTAAQVATVGSPGPQDLPFGEALVAYSRELASIHAFQGAVADERLAWEVRQLATVLERMPAAAQQHSLRRAAAQMRAADEGAEPSIRRAEARARRGRDGAAAPRPDRVPRLLRDCRADPGFRGSGERHRRGARSARLAGRDPRPPQGRARAGGDVRGRRGSPAALKRRLDHFFQTPRIAPDIMKVTTW